MKIVSWNVNGIRAVEKKGIVDWLVAEGPDVLGVQEIKATEDQLGASIREIPGYTAFFNPAQRKGYSGTAVYYRRQPLAISTGLPDERFNTEGRTIRMDYPELTLFNIYFPNGQKDEERLTFKLDFYECLLAHIDDLRAQGRRVVVFGDFNTAHHEIDLKNPKSNEKTSGFLPIERAFMDRLCAHGWVDTFRALHPDAVEYSWWSYRFNARSNNTGWRIDYHFIAPELREFLTAATIHGDVMGSDHCPVSIELEIPAP